MIMPVIFVATGIVTNGLQKILEAIPRKHSIDSLQRQLYLELHNNKESTAVGNLGNHR
jgi:hypothetical protein